MNNNNPNNMNSLDNNYNNQYGPQMNNPNQYYGNPNPYNTYHQYRPMGPAATNPAISEELKKKTKKVLLISGIILFIFGLLWIISIAMIIVAESQPVYELRVNTEEFAKTYEKLTGNAVFFYKDAWSTCGTPVNWYNIDLAFIIILVITTIFNFVYGVTISSIGLSRKILSAHGLLVSSLVLYILGFTAIASILLMVAGKRKESTSHPVPQPPFPQPQYGYQPQYPQGY